MIKVATEGPWEIPCIISVPEYTNTESPKARRVACQFSMDYGT